MLSLLHPNGRELIARLRDGGPWTLVLDECHHLLELWGRLLQAVIGQLDGPRGPEVEAQRRVGGYGVLARRGYELELAYDAVRAFEREG